MKKFLALFLAFLFVFSAVACQPAVTPPDNPDTPDNPDNPDPPTPAAAPLVLAENNAAAYVVVYDAFAKAQAAKLCAKMRSLCGVEFVSVAAGKKPEGKKGIYLGKGKGYDENGAAVYVTEDKEIYIGADTLAPLTEALNGFIRLLEKDENKTLTVDAGKLPMQYIRRSEVRYESFDNMTSAAGADPFCTYIDGTYYYLRSSAGKLYLSAFDKLTSIGKSAGTVVYTAPAEGRFTSDMWAPELFRIDGVWYIYVAMDDGVNANHRMVVLKNENASPLSGFTFVGQITDPSDKWAIDGTVLNYKGELYFIWSGWEGPVDGRQNLYIAHMSSPTTIDSSRVCIATAEEPWETKTQSPYVLEGPCAYVAGDRVFLLYSANGSWTDNYCIGYLYADGDLTDASSWKKSDGPVLSKTQGIYGPGHCSVTVDTEGVPVLVYHANNESGTGWSGRTIRVQRLTVTDGKIAPMTPAASAEIACGISYTYILVEPSEEKK